MDNSGNILEAKMKPSASNNPLERTSAYQVNGKSFIVTPVFRQDSYETLGSVLVTLMRTDSPA